MLNILSPLFKIDTRVDQHVNNVENEIFEVNVIPHSLKETNLKNLKAGSKVNFEIDMLARYLEKLTKK